MAVFKHLAVIVFALVVLRLLVTIYLDILGLRFLEKRFDFCDDLWILICGLFRQQKWTSWRTGGHRIWFLEDANR